MNELEKALEQLNIKYETNGKQYKIPTTKENLVELLKGCMAMNEYLQSKIDKAIEYIENNKIYQWNTYRDEDSQLCGEKIESDMISKSAILDILKEDK